MANNLKVPALIVTRAPIANKDGTATWAFLKILQDWSTRITNGLSQTGQFIGVIRNDTTISDRDGTIGTALQRLDADGSFASTNYIGDGAGSPLAGGKIAYAALVSSAPVAGRSLIYNGTNWKPDSVAYSEISGTPELPQTTTPAESMWFDGYDAPSGAFHASQPAFSNVSGRLETDQLPLAGFTGTVPLASLTTGGTQGALTITNGIITSVTEPT